MTIAAPPARAVDGPAEWQTEAHLFGDWRGLAAQLHEHGVSPWARYTGGFWSNLKGGFDTGTRYEGFAQWGAHVDLDTAFGWPDAQFHISWNAYHGGQPSKALIGQFGADAISGWEAVDSVRFYHIYVEQSLFAESLTFKVGQIAADDDFFVCDHAALFLNAVFGDFVSNTTTGGAPPVYPLAAPGIYVSALPNERWFARFGVYTADIGNDKAGNIGFDWKLVDASGAVWLAEAGTRRTPLGAPGTYSLGSMSTTADLTDRKRGGTEHGGWSLYAMADQVLLLDEHGARKLGAFVRGLFGPQQDRETMRWHLDAGLTWLTPAAARPDDRVGLAMSYTRFSNDYVAAARAGGSRVTDHEALLELTYEAVLTGWLRLRPDLQFFFDPHQSRRDAVAIGLRLVLDL